MDFVATVRILPHPDNVHCGRCRWANCGWECCDFYEASIRLDGHQYVRCAACISDQITANREGSR